MVRGLKLAVPTVGSGALRIAQLAVLLVLARHGESDQRDILLTAFGLLGVIGIFTDSGAGNYLLAADPETVSRALYRRVLLIQGSTAVAGVAVVLCSSLMIGDGAASSSTVAILASLSVTQTLDSLIRAAKAPLLAAGRDDRFGQVDLASSIGKLTIAGTALAAQETLILLAMPAISAGVLLICLRLARPRASETPLPRGVTLRVLEIGASGSLSALYSQAPLVIGVGVLSVADAAKLAAVTRIVQALEFLPATAAAQAIPRLRRNPQAVRRWWISLTVFGVTSAVALFLTSPWLERLLTLKLSYEPVVAVLGLALAIKFGNYILVSAMLAQQMMRTRLRITLTVAAVALTLGFTLSSLGLVALSATSVVTELLLLTLSTIALSRGRRPAGPKRLDGGRRSRTRGQTRGSSPGSSPA